MGLVALAVVLRYGFEQLYPTPRQVMYERENKTLRSEYSSLNNELQFMESKLSELRDRDDRFYRPILSLEPVPSSIREAGTGGSEWNRFGNLRDADFIMDVSHRVDKLSSKVQIQSRSLSNVYEKALDNQRFLASKPSINPISSGDPCWLTSTYGYRQDPFTHLKTAHHGIDLAGPYGLEVHCSGDGVVLAAFYNRFGYGKEVLVDHGFGYVSRYAHLQEILVKKGQKLKRGEVIGTLGSTGRSTGPHLHYEVRKNGRPVDPLYFFYENLTPEEYDLLASRANAGTGDYQAPALSQK